MNRAVIRGNWVRPQTGPVNLRDTVEAPAGCSFELREPKHNLVDCRSIDLRWATANVLHFFAATEEAGCLRKYNRFADRFLDGDRWLGAYGAIAKPQLDECIRVLSKDCNSRRAVVSMGGPSPSDMNRPACWSHLHLLNHRDQLDLLVYQRSLNLRGVMPYDCILLCNILVWVASSLRMVAGSLRWTIGSLHTDGAEVPLLSSDRNRGVVLPHSVLDDPVKCLHCLEHPEALKHPTGEWLRAGEEVRS
jgi:hypothetical protein